MQKIFHPLKKNAVVRIIAPGAGSPQTDNNASNNTRTSWDELEKCCELLRSWELTPVYSSTIFSEQRSFYNFANTDQQRYEDFVDAFKSDAAIVWAFRGGYGSDRIIRASIKNHFMPATSKLFIGFSDVTNIHSYILSRWQWPTLHAPSIRQLSLQLVDQADIDIAHEIILGKKNQIDFTLIPLNAAAQQPREIHAHITGGNLTVVQSALGTAWQTPVVNNIILLEDTGEAPYRIARIFQQMLAGGFLQSAKAIILGDFIPDTDMDMVLTEFANECDLPVLRCQGIGHGKNNCPVPLGMISQLFLGTTCRLVVKFDPV